MLKISDNYEKQYITIFVTFKIWGYGVRLYLMLKLHADPWRYYFRLSFKVKCKGNIKDTIELADYKVLGTNIKVSFKSKVRDIDWFSLLSLVLLYVSCKCYCWFSPISPIFRTRPWTFNTEQAPSDVFTWWWKQNQFPKRCVVISTSDCVCVLLCVCVYLYWYFGPPCVFWSVSSCVTNCHLGFFPWLLVFGCMWVYVCLGLYAILVFPRF
jgi:hypothetical protein